MADKIVWEEPPPQARKSKFTDYVEQMKANPKKWARINDASPQFAYDLRRGRFSDGDKTAFESTVRKVDGADVVYARYMGRKPRTPRGESDKD